MLVFFEWEAERPQQGLIFVVVFRGGYYGDVYVLDVVDLVLVDFVEYYLFGQIEGVVFSIVELFWGQAVEVVDLGQCERQQLVQEFLYLVVVQCYVGVDWYFFMQLELRDRFVGFGDLWFLVGDCGQVFYCAFDQFGVLRCFVDVYVYYDFGESGYLYDVRVFEFFVQFVDDFFVVFCFQLWSDFVFGYCCVYQIFLLVCWVIWMFW